MPHPRRSHALVHVALLSFGAITLVPFVYVLGASLTPSADAFSARLLPDPAHWTTANYDKLWHELAFGRHLLASLFLASVTAVVATLCSAMGGYALASFRFRGRDTVTAVVLATLVIPQTLLLAPSYELLYHLGLLDSFAGLVLPAAAPAFGIWLFRQAMIGSVPPALLDAARLDGCGEVRLFFTIVLPLVRPMVGAFSLVTFLGTWNNFIAPQIVLQSPERFPLAVAVAQLRGVYSHDYGLLMAGTVVSIAPVVVLFLLLQREFIAGLTSGAIKG